MNEEAKSEEQAPAFGPGTKTDDITIDYKPAAKPEEPGETDEPETPGDTHLKGDVIDNSKKDEATGTGKADSSTTITDTKKGEEINLDDELGKGVRPDWKTDKDAKLGDYTVDKVENSKDGNSKELTLKKTSEPETKEMSAEDVAKLLDVPEDGVEKKTDDEGKTTYTLKKEETSTDENGKHVLTP